MNKWVESVKELKVCIGSACHLKGSYEVIEALKALIQDHQLEDEVALKAAFCLGHCTHAVAIKRWDDHLLSASIDDVEAVFNEQIRPFLGD
jgi:NADH:ubiquinone oxidoreductase subunit E